LGDVADARASRPPSFGWATLKAPAHFLKDPLVYRCPRNLASRAKRDTILITVNTANTPRLTFLFDVDNTLLDNDAVTADLKGYLESHIGSAARERYFAIFEQLRKELGYADYLGALQRYRVEQPRDVHLLDLSTFLIDYPFQERVYPRALDVLAACRKRGPVAILSDGDVVFQPRKIRRAGLWDAVGGNVLIYIHKEEMLADVSARFPADHYVFVDDKLRLCDAIKKQWGSRVTTVFPRQGHYAVDPEILSKYPPADRTVERIGDLLDVLKHDWPV
jgi:FMN phosphatase YigB (HAD superfamily)